MLIAAYLPELVVTPCIDEVHQRAERAAVQDVGDGVTAWCAAAACTHT